MGRSSSMTPGSDQSGAARCMTGAPTERPPRLVRLPKMRDLVVEGAGTRGLRKLSRELGATVQLPSASDRRASTDGAARVVTAVELAQRVGRDPRTFRAWLRSKGREGHPILAKHRLNDPWEFTPEEADQIALEYMER